MMYPILNEEVCYYIIMILANYKTVTEGRDMKALGCLSQKFKVSVNSHPSYMLWLTIKGQ